MLVVLPRKLRALAEGPVALEELHMYGAMVSTPSVVTRVKKRDAHGVA